jgi:hypothetical protein
MYVDCVIDLSYTYGGIIPLFSSCQKLVNGKMAITKTRYSEKNVRSLQIRYTEF